MMYRETIIKNYIDGYNHFDIEKMTAAFDDTIIFENIQNSETNMSITGLTAFIKQAEQVKAYFSKRTQTIKSFTHFENTTEVALEYHAILGMDFSEELKKGQVLNLIGKSIFEFNGEKIIRLTDIS